MVNESSHNFAIHRVAKPKWQFYLIGPIKAFRKHCPLYFIPALVK